MPDGPWTRHGRGAAVHDRQEGFVQHLKLAIAADERRVADRRRRGLRHRWRSVASQSAKRLGTRQALLGIATQQSHADGAQICRHIRHHLRRSRWIVRSLAEQDVEERTGERDAPCERLVEGRLPRRTNRWLRMASHPNASSGDMYAGVPPLASPTSPACGGNSSAIRPKSRITTRPSGVTRTFDGLISRCSLPLRCSAETPSISCRRACTSRSSEASARSARVVDEAHAPDELHREETPLFLDEQFIEADQIRVSHIGEASELPLQTIEVGCAGAKQGLQSDDLVTDPVVHFVDHPHAARAQPSHHSKAPGAGKTIFGRHGRRQQIRRVIEKRERFLVGRQQAHHFRPKVWIARAGLIEVRLARG